jgi:hypothetical protein
MKKMKTNFLVVLLLLMISAVYAQKVDTLTNDKIIELSKMGLKPEVIITKINSSVTSFDMSTGGMISLNKAGVASNVITKMIEVDKINQESAALDSKDPNVMHSAGIFNYDPTDVNKPMKKIVLLKVNSYENGGDNHAGFGTFTKNAVLSGAASKQQIKGQSPVFYFYFNKKVCCTDFFRDPNSPQQFILLKTTEKPDKRTYVIGVTKQGWSSNSSTGIPEKDKIQFEFSPVSAGIYKVTVKDPLSPGEYVCIWPSRLDYAFDFGVH